MIGLGVLYKNASFLADSNKDDILKFYDQLFVANPQFQDKDWDYTPAELIDDLAMIMYEYEAFSKEN